MVSNQVSISKNEFVDKNIDAVQLNEYENNEVKIYYQIEIGSIVLVHPINSARIR